MTIGTCHLCGQSVDSLESHARRVCGWESVRKGAGGANRIIDRQVVGESIAHTLCCEQAARARRRGIAPGQGTLA